MAAAMWAQMWWHWIMKMAEMSSAWVRRLVHLLMKSPHAGAKPKRQKTRTADLNTENLFFSLSFACSPACQFTDYWMSSLNEPHSRRRSMREYWPAAGQAGFRAAINSLTDIKYNKKSTRPRTHPTQTVLIKSETFRCTLSSTHALGQHALPELAFDPLFHLFFPFLIVKWTYNVYLLQRSNSVYIQCTHHIDLKKIFVLFLLPQG